MTWDSHSLLVDGKRILLYSGEFHYFRLPSRALWRDRLAKMKAAGLNAVSIYFDWQYHSPSPGQYDFSGVRDIEYLLELTESLGLYVIARVGPYMNAEVDAGGLPGWLLTKQLYPRAQSWDGHNAHAVDSPLYEQYAREWYSHLLPILARHQVTTGGSVLLLNIENEYPQDTGSQTYMQDLYSQARANGITVPICHNDYYFRGDWAKQVDLYGFDSYPYGFDCCHQWWDTHFHGVDTWEHHLRNDLGITNTPLFVSELQGGAFQPWGGKGYPTVAATFGPDWLTDLDQSALAQGTTMLNTYMFAGGTSWGYMPEPDVFTSYDYGAPIAESGALRPAYYSAHRLGMFLQAYGTTLAQADAAPTLATATNAQVVVHVRRDPASGQIFVFLRHGDAGAAVETHVQLVTPSGVLTVPRKSNTAISMPGHGAALLTANVAAGPLHLAYSTSQVLTDAATAQGHYLVLYGPTNSDGETSFDLPAAPVSVVHNLGVTVTRKDGLLRLNYEHTAVPRTVALTLGDQTLRLVITDTAHASRFWLANGTLIAGPDLVTAASGQLNLATSAGRRTWVYGADPTQGFLIDGQRTAVPDTYMGSIDLGQLSGPTAIRFPALRTWRFSPEAPEVQNTFDDSGWAPANHTGTNNPNVAPSTSLLADDYGFHYGFVWYRGHFTASGAETSVTVNARHSYSVYLNGTYIGGGDAPLDDPPHAYTTPATFSFPAGVLRPGADNVLAILTESLGHDEGWVAGPAAQSPQGLIGAQLNGASTAIAWRIQGAQGGEQVSDTERGGQNASGLYGERNGWYLPQFDAQGWSTVELPDNWRARGISQDIGWYRSQVTLHVPRQDSSPIGLTLPSVSDKAMIWVNGWLMGRYWEQRGPQHTFYLPEGVLNPHGNNTIAIAVWNRGHDGGLTAIPRLVQYSSLAKHALVAAPAQTAAMGWLHTSGNRIVDAEGRPVRLAAVNWGGMQGSTYVPAGLDRQPLDTLLSSVRAMGFNTIRLPFSNELVERNPVVQSHLDANPDLRGLRALEIMDRIVASAGAHNLRVILDDHRSDAGADPEENGLWYTNRYPERSWIRDWRTLARRYRNSPAVVGVDLRDEPHTGPPGPWSLNTYLHQGATWGPYHGVDNPATDWRLGAQRGGNAVLAVNPHLLVLVEGLQQYPDAGQPGGVDSYWWGGIFQPAERYPLQLAIPHQLVYSPHEYGPFKYRMPFFNASMSYQSLSAVWQQHWGFLESPQYVQRGPIFIGEFGTCGTSPHCIQDATPGSQGAWFQDLMQYLRDHPEINWSFWALNGTNSAGRDQPNYVLQPDWHSPRLHALLDAFRDVEAAPPPG